MVTNIRYADGIILLATLVDRLDWVSRKYSLLINVDKTRVMANDGIACRVLIQNEQLGQVDTFQYVLGSLITEYDHCMTEYHCRKYGKVTAYRFQRSMTNESPSACNNVRLWKMDTQKV